MPVLDRMPWAAKDSVFRRLAKIAEVRNLTKEERLQYDQSLKHYRDSINVMRGAVEEGERKANLRNAKGMKDYGMPIDSISAITGLSIDEINKL